MKTNFEVPRVEDRGSRAKTRHSTLDTLPFLVGLMAVAVIPTLSAQQVLVDTLGGGPREGDHNTAAYTDGSTFFDSQFNGPVGLALSSDGTLFLADTTNGAIRKITAPGDAAHSLTSTFVSGLGSPTGVAVDGADNVYVLTSTSIKKYNSFGSFLATLTTGLTGATAVALDGSTNLYMTQLGGQVRKLTPAGALTTVATGFNSPKGIAVLDNGLLAVSDTGNHAIRLLNPATGMATLLAGGNGPGFTNGPGNLAAFNQPHGVAKSPSGTLVVADLLNHRFRLVATNGLVTTLYGVDPSLWSSDFPGWEDGDATVAAAHDPVSATVAPNGTVYTTELFYHLLRQATGASLGVPGSTSGGGTNVVVIPPPSFTPNSGYFPMGITVTVGSAYPTFYTTDGTEPTTGSAQVTLSGNVGTIQFNESLRDLTSLRLKAFNGTNASVTVSGVPAGANEIGVSRDMNAGSGSTVVVPIVANLRTNDQIRSIQFRVEVTPLNGAPPVRPNFRALSILSNDFIQVVGPALPDKVATYSATPYSIGTTRGLEITAIGAGADFFVQGFAVVAMLAVPIEPTAQEGQRYQVQVLFPTATSDGQQTPVAISSMASHTILITNLTYLVGDISPAGWYTAGEFGEGDLRNNDVNAVFYAAHGVHTPHSFSDVFDAMDAYPPDEPGLVGGDGTIDFFDWQLALQRSLRLDTNNWRRTNQRDADGRVVGNQATSLPPGSSPASPPPPPEGLEWFRQAQVSALSIANIIPGNTYSMPIFVKVVPGYSLSGLSFRLSLGAEPGVPMPARVQFQPVSGVPTPVTGQGLTIDELICGWSLGSFNPVLQGSNLLGHLEFRVPTNALPGQCYTLRFFNAGGGLDLKMPYKLESVPACAWILSPALRPIEIISDDWKTNFFGNLNNALAEDLADADGDGIPNWQEFLAGTNPTNRLSFLHLAQSQWNNGGFALRWLSAPGKIYLIEGCSALGAPWNILAEGVVGDGNLRELIDTNAVNRAQFYRIRLQP